MKKEIVYFTDMPNHYVFIMSDGWTHSVVCKEYVTHEEALKILKLKRSQYQDSEHHIWMALEVEE
jgi:hypothetical protein